MGTHPIFESDFDCLTESMIESVNVAYIALFAAGAYLAYTWLKKDEPIEEFNLKPMAATTVNPKQAVDDGDIISRMKSKGRNILILYGSQTGTAEDFSSNLAREAHKYEKMRAMVMDPEEIEFEDLSRLNEIENSVLVFAVATYGEGDPTDNLSTIWDWFKSDDVDETTFEGQKFAVFGLGNKTYEYFNEMGKFFDKRMEELGGERVVELGLGDDDANIEEDFNNWKEKFWINICRTFNVSRRETHGTVRQFQLKKEFNRERIFTGEIVRYNSHKNQRPPYDAKNPFYAKVAINKELHKGGNRSCMHIELDIKDSRIRYEAGDHVAVYPTNDPIAVDYIGKRLNIDLDEPFALENVDEDSSKKYPFPCPTTYRTALMHYVDIHGQPRANLLAELIQYATGDSKTHLEKLCGVNGNDAKEAKKMYQKWVLDESRTIYQILEDLPELKNIPIDHLVELLPRLQPRYYSIASSPKGKRMVDGVEVENKDSVAICAILVKYETGSGRTNTGVATGYMKNKIPSQTEDVPSPKVPCFIRRSQFKLPFKQSTPIIMIGPGTGIAPFRGFLQERHFKRTEAKEINKKNGKENAPCGIGDCILFTGCRNRAVDYVYDDELEEFKNNGTLSQLFVAFSRDQEEKIYVQHLLAKEGELVWKVIQDGGHIYVCGDAKNMARDVQDVILNIISEYKKVPKSSAQDYLKSMRNKGKYQEDVWS